MKATRLFAMSASPRARSLGRSGPDNDPESLTHRTRSRELVFTRPLRTPRGSVSPRSDKEADDAGDQAGQAAADSDDDVFVPAKASEVDLLHAKEVLESELERARQTFPRESPRDESSLNAGHMVGDDFEIDKDVGLADRKVLRQNWKFQEWVTRRRRWTTNMLLGFAVLASVAVVMEQEFLFQGYQECTTSDAALAARACQLTSHNWLPRTVLKGVIALSSVVMSFLVYLHYRTKLAELYQREQFDGGRISLWRSPFLGRFVVELLFNLLHVPPGIEWVIRANDYSDKDYPVRLSDAALSVTNGTMAPMTNSTMAPVTNSTSCPAGLMFVDSVTNGAASQRQFCEVLYHMDVLNLFVCLRLYHLLRFLTLYSSLNSSSSKFIRQFTTVKPKPSLVVKYLVDRMPLRFLLISLGILMLSMAYGLKQCEQIADQRLGSFANSLWLTYISLTSVGYGDFYPRTLCGRGVQIVNVSAGLVFSSLVIAVVGRQLRYHTREASYIRVINRDSVNRQTRTAAAIVIQRFYRFHLAARAAGVRTGPPRLLNQAAAVAARASETARASAQSSTRSVSLDLMSPNNAKLPQSHMSADQTSADQSTVRAVYNAHGRQPPSLVPSFVRLYEGKRRWKDVQRTARDERFFDPSTEQTIALLDRKQDHVEDYIEQLEHYINVRFELQKRSLVRIENALLKIAAASGALPKDAAELPDFPTDYVRPSVAAQLKKEANSTNLTNLHVPDSGTLRRRAVERNRAARADAEQAEEEGQQQDAEEEQLTDSAKKRGKRKKKSTV